MQPAIVCGNKVKSVQELNLGLYYSQFSEHVPWLLMCEYNHLVDGESLNGVGNLFLIIL